MLRISFSLPQPLVNIDQHTVIELQAALQLQGSLEIVVFNFLASKVQESKLEGDWMSVG